MQRSVVLVVTSPSSPVSRPRLGVSTALVVESPVIFSNSRSENSLIKEGGPYTLGGIVNVFKLWVVENFLLFRELRNDIKVNKGLEFAAEIFSFVDLL